MDFRQLEAFVKVIELGSFSKAADELYVSQPSISNYITSLEKELNTVLINRSTKALSTTLAGERFLGKARELLALKRETIDMLGILSQDASGEIRILASSVPALYMLPRILAEFCKLYPKASFSVRQADTLEVVQGIAAHKADIGFAGSIIGEKKCDFLEFATEELAFIAPNDGTYREDKTYALEELLCSGSFIARESGSGTRIQYERFFAQNGILPEKIEACGEMDSTHGVINAVMSGLGVSIVSRLAAQDLFLQGRLMPLKLEIPLPSRKIYMVRNRGVVHAYLPLLFSEFVPSAIYFPPAIC